MEDLKITKIEGDYYQKGLIDDYTLDEGKWWRIHHRLLRRKNKMSKIVIEFVGVPKQLLQIVSKKEIEKIKEYFQQGDLRDRVLIRIED